MVKRPPSNSPSRGRTLETDDIKIKQTLPLRGGLDF